MHKAYKLHLKKALDLDRKSTLKKVFKSLKHNLTESKQEAFYLHDINHVANLQFLGKFLKLLLKASKESKKHSI